MVYQLKYTITILITLALFLVLALGYVNSGLFDSSAMTPHSKLARWALSTTMHVSVERRARKIEVPEFTEEMRLAGANDFNSMCAACHGAPGRKPEPMGQGLNPQPPDLAESAQHLTAAELFWVTKNGIRMTGMPAWGISHDDASLWPVVAFMLTLPDLEAQAYQDLLIRAERVGHHVVEGQAAHEPGELPANGEEGTDSRKDGGHSH